MSKNFNVAMLQINDTGNIDTNIEKGIEYCKKAKEMGAHIAVFPEMWSNGYEHIFYGYIEKQDKIDEEKVRQWQDKAIDKNSEYVKRFIETAKQLKMAIAITYLEKHNPQPRNTVSIIDEKGKIVLDYSKYSPITVDENGNEVNNELLVMGTNEDVQVVSFDMEKIRKYRQNYYLGDAYRKPFAYKDIIENYPKAPFIRKDARR